MAEASEVVISEYVPAPGDKHPVSEAVRHSKGVVKGYWVVLKLDNRYYESVHAVPAGVTGARLTEMLTFLATQEAKKGGHLTRVLGQTE